MLIAKKRRLVQHGLLKKLELAVFKIVQPTSIFLQFFDHITLQTSTATFSKPHICLSIKLAEIDQLINIEEY